MGGIGETSSAASCGFANSRLCRKTSFSSSTSPSLAFFALIPTFPPTPARPPAPKPPSVSTLVAELFLLAAENQLHPLSLSLSSGGESRLRSKSSSESDEAEEEVEEARDEEERDRFRREEEREWRVVEGLRASL